MAKVGEAFFELTARDAGLFKSLSQAEGRLAASGKVGEQAIGGGVTKGMVQAEQAVAGGTTRMGGMMANVGGETTKLNSKMGELKTGIVQGLGIGGFMAVSTFAAGFISKISDSVQMASSLSETVSKVRATFGTTSPVIEAWAKTTSSSMGIAEASALDYSSTFGGLLQNFGLTAEAAAPMSQSMVQLAADMASFSNSTPEEALDALRSGLIGESEPLRRFQVNLNEARIQAKALELGLYSGKGALDASAKAQATYAIIMEDTSRQQGDFAKTSEGLANQQRTAAAKSQEAWTAFGAALLPLANVVLPAIANAGTAVVTFLTSLLTNVDKMTPALIVVGGVITGVLVPAFAAWAAGAIIALPATVALFAPLFALGVAIAGVVVVIEKLGGIGAVLKGVESVIKTVVVGIIGAVKMVVDVAAAIPGPWQEGAKAVSATLSGMQNDVKNWGNQVATTAGATGGVVSGGFATSLVKGAPAVAAAGQTGIVDPVKASADAAKKAAVEAAAKTPAGIAAALASSQGSMIVAAGKLAATVPTSIADAAAAAVKIVRKTPAEMASALLAGRSGWQDAWDAFKNDTDKKMTRAEEIASIKAKLAGKSIANGLASTDPDRRAAAAAIVAQLEARLGALKTVSAKAGDTAGKDLATAIKNTKKGSKDAADLLALQVKNSLGTLPSSAYGYGTGAGRELAAGANSKTGAVSTAAGNLKTAAIDPVKAAAARARWWGEQLARSFASGIGSREDAVSDAAAGIARAAGAWIAVRSPTELGIFSQNGGPEGYGRNLGTGWAKGIASAVPSVMGAADRLAAAALPRVGGMLASSSFSPTIRASIVPGSLSTQAQVRVVHEIRDPSGSLAKIGTTPATVAGMLANGLDATGLLSNLRHEASMT